MTIDWQFAVSLVLVAGATWVLVRRALGDGGGGGGCGSCASEGGGCGPAVVTLDDHRSEPQRVGTTTSADAE